MNITVSKGSFIVFTYTNWKGETSVRKAIVSDFSFGSNEYHKEPQFMILAFDVEKSAYRTFATKDIKDIKVHFTKQKEVNTMNCDYQRIPTHDILGNRIKIGEKAIIFSKHGISYEGTIVQIGGKRWFQVDEGFRIGGIGNHYLIKS